MKNTITILPLYCPDNNKTYHFLIKDGTELLIPADCEVDKYFFNGHNSIYPKRLEIPSGTPLKNIFYTYNHKTYVLAITLPASVYAEHENFITFKYYDKVIMVLNSNGNSNNQNQPQYSPDNQFRFTEDKLEVPGLYKNKNYEILIHIKDSDNLYETITYNYANPNKNPKFSYEYLGQAIFENLLIVPQVIDKQTGATIIYPTLFISNSIPEISKYLSTKEQENVILFSRDSNSSTTSGTPLLLLNKNIGNGLTGNSTNNTSINGAGNSGTTIKIQPVFIKTHNLSSIELISGITQNIAITGLEYLYNKVDYFIIKIGDAYQTREIGRLANNSGVVFKIERVFSTGNAPTENTTSKYHILDQDGNYITSGNLKII